MTIWIFALFLMLMFGSAGAMGGGIRLSIQLLGVIISFSLASPLSPMLDWVPKVMGFHNPVTAWALPPILTFVLLNLIFASIAFGVHHKIEIHYQYRAADDVRLNWERVNSRLGIIVGMIVGSLYVVILGVLIHTAGYFTTQVKNGTSDPMGFQILTRMTADMKTTGLDRVVLAVSPVGENFYLTSDLVGLLYHNPDLRKRLMDYPLFNTLEDRPDFQAFEEERRTNYLARIASKTNFMVVLKSGMTQELMKNKDLQALYRDMDLGDVLKFATNGTSPKYEKEKLLGRWQLDLVPTVQAIRKKRNPPLPELKYLTTMYRSMLKDITIVASANNQISVRGSIADGQTLGRVLAYTLPKNIDISKLSTNFSNTNIFKTFLTGTWKSGSSDSYTLTLGELGDSEVTLKDDRLTTTVGGQPVVFGKVD